MPSHTVRRGSLSDIPWIIEELKEFSEFYGTRAKLFPGEEMAKSQLEKVIDGHVLFVSERDGLGTGFIAGLVTPHFFNPEIVVLTEILWWVSERHRGSFAGYLLLQKFTEFGRDIADWTIMTTECKSSVSDRTFSSMGYQQYEKSFLLEA